MIAMKNKEFVVDEALNQIEVTVAGKPFYLYTPKNEDAVFQQVHDFLGGSDKPQVVAVLDVPHKRKPGRPRKNLG